MASETVQDIIIRIRGMHSRLGWFYQALGDAASKERVKLLLNYISRHERNLEEALGQYQHQATRAVLDTWYKATPGSTLTQELDQLKITADMTADEVVTVVLAADQKLVDQFRQLAGNAASEEVRDLFQKLIAIEEREEHQLVRDALELEDV